MPGSRLPYGFEPGHEPVYKVPKRKKGGPTPSHVPSRKSVSGKGIRAAHPLMREYLWHLEVDPSVRFISPYPMKVEYQTFDRYGPNGTATHIPDLGILKTDGSAVYCDVVPEAILKEQWYRERRRLRLEETYADQFGAAYSILTELAIHIQPRMDNVSRLWRDNRTRDPEAMRAVRRVIDGRDGTATTIGSIVGMTGYPNREVAVACVLQLAVSGEIKIDLGRPISENTAVTFPSVDAFDGEG
ncbi:hypothetical protein AB9E06_05860 [Rhizobium leguminosarum]|uniref:hypothetical protein n=1 Tax=Rhizobium leguminosarum TaxID=384 RepID=UPI003F94AACC